MNALSDWKYRSFLIACLVVAPFLKFLIRNQTGLLHVEVAAAILLLAGVSIILGFLARGAAFYFVLAACIVLVSSYPLQDLLQPRIHLYLWQAALAIAAATGLAMWAMRERFFPVMAVFVGAGLLVEIAPRLMWKAHAKAANGSGHHVLWLILDEQIGLGGFPDFPACVSARTTLQDTLDRNNFTSFPNAFSNYGDTIDSVPSVINARLLRYPRELIAKTGTGNLRHYQVVENGLFAKYAATGLAPVGYQHGSLRECDASFSSADCHQYQDRLGWLYRAPGGWKERFRWIVGTYEAGDPLLGRINAFFPFRFGLKITGPLALTDLWPNEFAEAIAGQTKPSLIFAHLLTPHSPYLFRRDGSIRPIEEWSGDRADQRVDAREYASRYGRYCEQAEFTARQLSRLFQVLNQHGVLQTTTIVVQGDHGARVRQKLGNPDDDRVMPDIYDYRDDPTSRDLQDRFSTLLAIKLPSAAKPAVNEEKHSLLTFLARELDHREPADGVEKADRVYLVNAKQEFQPIDILKYWR